MGTPRAPQTRTTRRSERFQLRTWQPHFRSVLLAVLIAALGSSGQPRVQADSTVAADSTDDDLARVVADYTGLYTRDRLPEWRALFLPGFVAGSTRPDGTVLQRNLDEFYEAQRKYLATGRAIKEWLENVRVERKGPLASVWADFVLEEEGERSRGKLVLTLISAEGRFRIHSLVFAYDR